MIGRYDRRKLCVTYAQGDDRPVAEVLYPEDVGGDGRIPPRTRCYDDLLGANAEGNLTRQLHLLHAVARARLERQAKSASRKGELAVFLAQLGVDDVHGRRT